MYAWLYCNRIAHTIDSKRREKQQQKTNWLKYCDNIGDFVCALFLAHDTRKRDIERLYKQIVKRRQRIPHGSFFTMTSSQRNRDKSL